MARLGRLGSLVYWEVIDHNHSISDHIRKISKESTHLRPLNRTNGSPQPPTRPFPAVGRDQMHVAGEGTGQSRPVICEPGDV
jgi:hypothetical protein